MRKVSRAPLYANPSTPLQAYLRELNIGAMEAQIWQKSTPGMLYYIESLLSGSSQNFKLYQDEGIL